MRSTTLSIDAYQEPDPTTGATIIRGYMTFAYVQNDPRDHKGYAFNRAPNPRFKALQDYSTLLEKAT